MNVDLKTKKIALVFDWLDDNGGMEQVNLALADVFPNAPIFTSVYDHAKFPDLEHRVKPSWLQKLPAQIRPKHQLLAPFMPMAFKRFDLSEYDLIISSASSGFAKCVRKTRSDQTHVCYCHTPVRYLYHAREDYLHNYPLPWYLKPFKIVLPLVLRWLKMVDQDSIKNVDHFVANSSFIAERIDRYYSQSSAVVYPGVDIKKFAQEQKNSSKKDYYFLALGRFIPYKKFDLLVETFAANKLPLRLAGVGPELERCRQMADDLGADNIEFLGFVDQSKLPGLYAGARAFLFPAEEDFGLTPVEAMASGLPVIYYASGGAVESVGDMGVGFDQQSSASLQITIENFLDKEQSFSSENITKRANQFTTERFQKNFLAFLEQHVLSGHNEEK